MIHKIKFQAHSVAISQNADSGDAFLGVYPDVAAELGCGGGQGRHGELIEAKFLCKFPHLLAHGDNVGFLIDGDFPGLCRLMRVTERGKNCHKSPILVTLRDRLKLQSLFQ